MNQGFTVTPQGYESDTGEWVYTDTLVEGSAGREMAQAREVREQPERFETNEFGSHQYNNQASDADFNNLVEMHGGQERYQDIMQWANTVASEDDIDTWNRLVEQGDLNALDDAMRKIAEAYQNRSEDVVTNTDADAYEVATYIYDNVLNEKDYQKMVDRAADVLDEATIQQFNAVVESGTKEQVEDVVRLLHQKIYN